MTARNWFAILSLLAACLSCERVPRANAASDFYAGKTLTIGVSSEPGAGYDSYTRLLARHLQKYIPGSPVIVIKNEPGGGGLRIAQELYSVAPKDGTELGNLRASTMLDAALGVNGADFDPTRFEWVGNMARDTDLCSFWYKAGIHSFSDLLHKQVIVGASGKGAQNWSFTNAINHVLHTKMKIISGYKGMGDRVLALERGELQGNCGINASSMTSGYPELLADGKVIPVMQSGLHPYPALPHVPLTQSFAKNAHDKKVLVTIFSQMDIARTFAFPPGTPKDRVDILRKAFMQAMTDPTLVAEAKQERLDIGPSSGGDVARLIAQMADLTPQMKSEIRTDIGE